MLKKIIFFVVIIALITYGRFGAIPLFSQEAGKTYAEKMENSPKQDSHAVKIQLLSESDIRKKLNSNINVVAFKAFRKNDTGICSECGDEWGQACWSTVKHLAIMRDMAKGNCDGIPVQYGEYKEVCNGLRSGCANLAGDKRKMCNALKSGDTNLLREAFSDPNFPEHVENIPETAVFYVNIYNGFQKGSKSACEKFNTNNIVSKISCDAIFGTGDISAEVNSMTRDLLIFDKAKKLPNKNLCGNIKNPTVKKMCLDDTVTNLSSVLKQVWN